MIISRTLQWGAVLPLLCATWVAQAADFSTHVSVTRRQRPVRALHAHDFTVQIDGRTVPVRAVTEEQLPLDIVLVMAFGMPLVVPSKRVEDPASRIALGEVTSRYLAGMEQNNGANAVKPRRPDDRIAVVSYGQDPHIALEFTSDTDRIGGAIQRAATSRERPEKLAAFVAIDYAIHMLSDLSGNGRALTERRRLIVYTGLLGAPGTRGYPDEALIRRLRDRKIVLSNLFTTAQELGSAAWVQEMLEPVSPTYRVTNLAHVADATGGETYIRLDKQDPPDILTPLRLRYVVTFDWPDDIPRDTGKVTIKLADETRGALPDASVEIQ